MTHPHRSPIRLLASVAAVVVIGIFGWLMYRRTAQAPAPSTQPPVLQETVQRGMKPEDELALRAKLAELEAKKAANDQEGKRDIGLLLRLGTQHYMLGELGLAAAFYRDILSTHPQDTPALENLGQALYEMGDYVGALDAWQRAANLAPSELTYSRIVDLIRDKIPNQSAAIPLILEQGIKTMGQSYDLLIRLGDWYATQGDYQRAASHYEVALQLYDNAEARNLLEDYRQKMREKEAQERMAP